MDPLRYMAGGEIRTGDAILFHGESGVVDFIAKAEDLETAWYVGQYGRGCMIRATGFGLVFLSDPEKAEDLELVARADSSAKR